MVHELCSTREIWGRRLVLREESEREEADKKCVVYVKADRKTPVDRQTDANHATTCLR